MLVAVGIKIDGGVVNYFKYYSKDEVTDLQNEGRPVVFDSVRHSEGVDLNQRVDFQFGSLTLSEHLCPDLIVFITQYGTDENIDLDQDVLEREVSSLGSIRVLVERVTRKPRKTPVLEQSFYYPRATLEGSKELVKHKHVSMVMQFVLVLLLLWDLELMDALTDPGEALWQNPFL